MKECIAITAAAIGVVAGGQQALAQSVPSAPEEKPAPSQQSGTGSDFYGEGEIGLRYDSAVALDELDVTSRQADEALRLRLRLGFEADLNRETQVDVSYGLTQTSYEEFTTFDLQTHTLAASLSHDLGPARAALDYRFIHARLDQDGLLNIHRVNPSLSGFVVDGLYARAEVLYRDSDFLGRSDRDNQSYGGGLALYLFMDGTNRFISAGYDYENSNAVDNQFDFLGHTVQIQASQRFPFAADKGRIRLGWRYQLRDYTSITTEIGQEREDNRHRLRAELELPVLRWLTLSTRYTYSDFGSNLETVDYSQNVVDVALATEF